MAQNRSDDEEFARTLDEFTQAVEDAANKAEEEYFHTLNELHETQTRALGLVVDRLKALDDRVKLLESLSPRPDGDGG